MIVESTPLVGPPLRTPRVRFSLLALLLFVTVACLALGWAVQSQEYVTEVLFQVKAAPTSIFGTTSFNEREFDILRHTQVELIKSNFVLQSALRGPGIASLPILASQKDPVASLRKHLEVEFPDGSEILAIRMRCTEGAQPDVCKMLDSVAMAYLNEVVFAEDQARLVGRDALPKAVANGNRILQSKLESLDSTIKESGKDSVAAKMRQMEIDVAVESSRKAQSALMELDTEAESPKRIIEIQPAVSRRE